MNYGGTRSCWNVAFIVRGHRHYEQTETLQRVQKSIFFMRGNNCGGPCEGPSSWAEPCEASTVLDIFAIFAKTRSADLLPCSRGAEFVGMLFQLTLSTLVLRCDPCETRTWPRHACALCFICFKIFSTKSCDNRHVG